MSLNRIIFSDKSVEHATEGLAGCSDPEQERVQVKIAVQRALNLLTRPEREVIISIYFLGCTYADVSIVTNRRQSRLKTLHRQALRKLRRALAGFVKDRYGLSVAMPDCEICRSAFKHEIEHLAAAHSPGATWQPLLRHVRERFGLEIYSPQGLINHQKYHTVTSIEMEGDGRS